RQTTCGWPQAQSGHEKTRTTGCTDCAGRDDFAGRPVYSHGRKNIRYPNSAATLRACVDDRNFFATHNRMVRSTTSSVSRASRKTATIVSWLACLLIFDSSRKKNLTPPTLQAYHAKNRKQILFWKMRQTALRQTALRQTALRRQPALR